METVPVSVPTVGEFINFTVGIHSGSGKVSKICLDGRTILVEVAPAIYEVVYADEVVR